MSMKCVLVVFCSQIHCLGSDTLQYTANIRIWKQGFSYVIALIGNDFPLSFGIQIKSLPTTSL